MNLFDDGIQYGILHVIKLLHTLFGILYNCIGILIIPGYRAPEFQLQLGLLQSFDIDLGRLRPLLLSRKSEQVTLFNGFVLGQGINGFPGGRCFLFTVFNGRTDDLEPCAHHLIK